MHGVYFFCVSVFFFCFIFFTFFINKWFCKDFFFSINKRFFIFFIFFTFFKNKRFFFFFFLWFPYTFKRFCKEFFFFLNKRFFTFEGNTKCVVNYITDLLNTCGNIKLPSNHLKFFILKFTKALFYLWEIVFWVPEYR